MTLIIFLFILGLLIIVHEFGHFIVAKKAGVKVEKFSLGFGRVILSREKNGTQYSLCAIPLGGYVKMAGDNIDEFKGKPEEYLAKPVRSRAAIVFAGPLLNYVLGFLCFWLIFFAGFPMLTAKVGGSLEGFGAQEAGIMKGDRIIRVDGKGIIYWEELQRAIAQKKDSSVIKVSVLREDKEFDVDVKVKETEQPDIFGQKHSVRVLGIRPAGEVLKVRHGFWQSAGLGLKETWKLSGMTYKGLWLVITGRLPFKDSVTGPLGIFQLTSEAAQIGFTAIVHLIALLSVSLAIFNLLPFPVLDGGHILLLAVEKIRKKPLGMKSERLITQFGLTLIITLAVLVTFNDLVRFKDRILNFFIK